MTKNLDSLYRPRLSIEISRHQADRLRELIPHGLKNPLFCAIVDDVIALLDEFGAQVLLVVIDRKIRPRECLKTLHLEEKKNADG